MKLYSTIEQEHQIQFNATISDELMAYMLHQIMSNTKLRQYALKLFKNYKNIDMQSNNNFCRLIKFT